METVFDIVMLNFSDTEEAMPVSSRNALFESFQKRLGSFFTLCIS